MSYSDAEIWAIIVLLGLGTFAIRFSFLGWLGQGRMPDWLLRHLRYVPVAVMPGLIAPMLWWPPRDAGADPALLAAAAVALALGLWTRGVVIPIAAGVAVLYGLPHLV
jgi:branched-subunit amino acid transport protein